VVSVVVLGFDLCVEVAASAVRGLEVFAAFGLAFAFAFWELGWGTDGAGVGGVNAWAMGFDGVSFLSGNTGGIVGAGAGAGMGRMTASLFFSSNRICFVVTSFARDVSTTGGCGLSFSDDGGCGGGSGGGGSDDDGGRDAVVVVVIVGAPSLAAGAIGIDGTGVCCKSMKAVRVLFAPPAPSVPLDRPKGSCAVLGAKTSMRKRLACISNEKLMVPRVR